MKKVAYLVILVLLSLSVISERTEFGTDVGNIVIDDNPPLLTQQTIFFSDPNPEVNKRTTITLEFKPTCDQTHKFKAVLAIGKDGKPLPGLPFDTQLKCNQWNKVVLSYTPTQSGKYQFQYSVFDLSAPSADDIRVKLEVKSGVFSDYEISYLNVGKVLGFTPYCKKIGVRDITVGGVDVGEVITKSCWNKQDAPAETTLIVKCFQGYMKSGDTCVKEPNFSGDSTDLKSWTLTRDSDNKPICAPSRTGFSSKSLCEQAHTKIVPGSICGDGICLIPENQDSCASDCVITPTTPGGKEIITECSGEGSVISTIACNDASVTVLDTSVCAADEEGNLIVQEIIGNNCLGCEKNTDCAPNYACIGEECLLPGEMPPPDTGEEPFTALATRLFEENKVLSIVLIVLVLVIVGVLAMRFSRK